MYRRHRRQKADGLGRRVCASSSSGPVITGPMYFAMAAQGVQKKAVAFALPNRYVEKANLGTRRNPRSKNEARNVVHVDDQCRFQVGFGYVAARQRAIDLAMAIDEGSWESTGLRLVSHRGVMISVLRCVGLTLPRASTGPF